MTEARSDLFRGAVDPASDAFLRRRARDEAEGRVLPFRPRERVRRGRRRRWPRLVGLLVVALALVAAPAATAGWVLTSERFALTHLEVTAGERVPASWVESILAPARGRNLVSLPLGRLAERLERHPWVAGVELTKHLPDTLRAEVHERRAAALLRQDGELWYVDEEGLVVAPFDPLAPPADLLVVSRRASEMTEPVLPALAFAAEVSRARPEWGDGLSEIEIVGEEDFRIFTSSLPFPVLARAGTLDRKAERLRPLLPEIAGRYGAVTAVDLRFRRRIIVQPATPGEAPRPRNA